MVSRELDPQNIEGLSIRLEKLGKVMDRASRLVENPGGSDWQPSLQIDGLSGAKFLNTLATVGKETLIINDDLIPALKRKTNELAQTIVLTQAEEAIKEIRVFAQNGIISKELLERAEKEFETLRAETTPQPVKPEILPTEQQDQDKLTFEVRGKVVSVARKEFYATEDIREAINNKNPKYIQNELYRAMQRNPNIQPHHRGGTGLAQGKKLYFTEETFVQIVTDILQVMRRGRRKQGVQQAPSATENTLARESTPQLRGHMQKQFMELLGPGEPVAKSTLMALYKGALPKNQEGSVRAEISYLRATGFIIETIRGTNTTFYVYKGKREATPRPKDPSAIETPAQETTQITRTLALPLIPLTLESLKPQIQPQPPIEERTIFVASDTDGHKELPVKEEIGIEEEPEQTDLSPLTGIVVRPVQETPRPESGRRITQKEKDQVTLKAVAYVLSKIAATKSEEINRNIRVILGVGLPPKTTLPQVFGQATDDDLKTDFIGSFANEVENLWNKDQSPEDLSDEENQIIQACRELRQQKFTVPQLVHDVSRILRTLPPRKYMAS